MSNQGISISKGIISSESISIIIDNEARKYIQAQISIALGSSGGALLDSRGKLIGITTLRLKDRYGNPSTVTAIQYRLVSFWTFYLDNEI